MWMHKWLARTCVCVFLHMRVEKVCLCGSCLCEISRVGVCGEGKISIRYRIVFFFSLLLS